MTFKVTAKRYGDQVQFALDYDEGQTKEAYEAAKTEANRIFNYKAGEIGAPTVSVVPVLEKEE